MLSIRELNFNQCPSEQIKDQPRNFQEMKYLELFYMNDRDAN